MMVDPALEVNGMTIVEDVPKTLKLMGSVCVCMCVCVCVCVTSGTSLPAIPSQ